MNIVQTEKTVTIDGITYSKEFFRMFTVPPEGRLFRILKVDYEKEGSVITVHTYEVDLEAFEAWQKEHHEQRLTQSPPDAVA